MVYDEQGQIMNRNLGEYNIPSFDDIPRKLNTFALELKGSDELHGIGETLLPPVMAAIGNAVYNAAGARIRDLPITPEKVLRELRTNGAKG
jgi:CO/xanthine dehydrogenase Mo-binding subunit